MFKRDGGKALFVKGGLATKRQIALVIPKSLEKYMANTAGKPVATRFRLRVLATKLSKTFTAAKSSPVIGPEKPPADGRRRRRPRPTRDCDGDGQLNSADPDDDNDLLADAQELALKLDPCSGDSDGDGVEDGFEYQSAIDLNNDDYQHANYVTPFPGKTPYPNPLFADADVDYDGDGLDARRRVQALEVHLRGQPHRDAHADAAVLLRRRAVLALAAAGGNGIRQPTMTVSAYQPPKTFRTWADATGYGTRPAASASTAATPARRRPLRHGPRRRRRRPRRRATSTRAEAHLLGPRRATASSPTTSATRTPTASTTTTRSAAR